MCFPPEFVLSTHRTNMISYQIFWEIPNYMKSGSFVLEARGSSECIKRKLFSFSFSLQFFTFIFTICYNFLYISLQFSLQFFTIKVERIKRKLFSFSFSLRVHFRVQRAPFLQLELKNIMDLIDLIQKNCICNGGKI